VLRYFREERAAMLEEICAGNAAALAAVRLSDNGMAVAAAVRQLEAMRQTVAEETGNGFTRHAPGLVVQIINGATGKVEKEIGRPVPAPPLQIEAKAEREALEAPE
jgi:hypothetical protein